MLPGMACSECDARVPASVAARWNSFIACPKEGRWCGGTAV